MQESGLRSLLSANEEARLSQHNDEIAAYLRFLADIDKLIYQNLNQLGIVAQLFAEIFILVGAEHPHPAVNKTAAKDTL